MTRKHVFRRQRVSNPKISDATKTHEAQFNMFDVNGTLLQKLLSCRLQQCFGTFNTLISKGCSETEVLRKSSNQIFLNQSLRVSYSDEGNLYFKMFKILCRF